MKLLWLDESSKPHQLTMEQLTIYIIPSGLSHGVINEATTTGHLLEFADGPQRDVISVDILEGNK